MVNLGVIGKPSDWLIASDVDYKYAKEKFGINLIDIDIKELIDLSNASLVSYPMNKFGISFDRDELNKAYRIYDALKIMVKKYDLKGLTVRCFDLLDTVKSTSCLAFSLLNSEGIIATCEGDIPSLISMYLIYKIYKAPSFQANPSKIDTDNNKILLAHCTLPLSMTTSYKLKTHYESGIGIGVKGELKEDDILIFKLSNDLKKYVLLSGKITENLERNNLCRTQIIVNINEDVTYFLKRPLQNHHIIFYKEDKEKIIKYLDDLNLIRIF
ncbi:MAG: hypothetical protein K6G38_03445 [Gammaproteobacteria bacterium]|nr:hypothetical protein [Gammaproteobacteria bacterium]